MTPGVWPKQSRSPVSFHSRQGRCSSTGAHTVRLRKVYPVINNTGPINQHHPYLILIYCKWENISKILLRNERKQRRYISSSCSASDMCGRSVCNCAPGKITQYATERSALCPYVFYLSLALLSLHTVWICAVFFYFSPRSSIRLLWICENRDDVEHDTRACQFV